MKAAWINDIHLEFLTDSKVNAFFDQLRHCGADIVLIGGDIAQAKTVVDYLQAMKKTLGRPICFVLGNHDFYHGSIRRTRDRIKSAVATPSERLHWMNTEHVVQLTKKTALVGHDGWGDGGWGDYNGSDINLNDFILIEELAGLNRNERLQMIRNLGAEAANHFRRVLPQAYSNAEHVVVLTHVPPFVEASWHNGRPCDPDWLPFFTCKAVGKVLEETMQMNPIKRMTVLCGHTHGGGVAQILPNLVAYTGDAEYGFPKIQKIFEWD